MKSYSERIAELEANGEEYSISMAEDFQSLVLHTPDGDETYTAEGDGRRV